MLYRSGDEKLRRCRQYLQRLVQRFCPECSGIVASVWNAVMRFVVSGLFWTKKKIDALVMEKVKKTSPMKRARRHRLIKKERPQNSKKNGGKCRKLPTSVESGIELQKKKNRRKGLKKNRIRGRIEGQPRKSRRGKREKGRAEESESKRRA